MERNTPCTGPVHVPLGHVVASEKWRGSQLAQEMQGRVKLVFEDGLTPVDFYLSNRSCILYITEADLVAGSGYRKRLVRVRNSNNLQGIVVVEKTRMSEQYFSAIQKFTVLDLGMVLLPVASQMEASCLIVQLASFLRVLYYEAGLVQVYLSFNPARLKHFIMENSKMSEFFRVQEQTKEPSKNPFIRKKRALLSEPFLLRTVQQIPGVGKVKAPLLLQKFPSIQQLSNASIQELEPVVGHVVAQQIHAFFTQSR